LYIYVCVCTTGISTMLTANMLDPIRGLVARSEGLIQWRWKLHHWLEGVNGCGVCEFIGNKKGKPKI
jgi:hypothetical protein